MAHSVKTDTLVTAPSRFTRAASDPPPSESAKSHLLRNNFELEPNPFEQSFSASSIRSSDTRSTARDGVVEEEDKKPARRARSQSPSTKTPGGGQVNRLPAVSSIISPSVGQSHDAHSFGWGMDHSLRSGPLSPAMLHGPTSASNGGFGMSSYFDANSFRTGLTPSGSGGLSFAPQSPNTAALFAMMTNQGQTPDAGGMTSGTSHGGLVGMPQIGRDMPNHFETGFGAALGDKKESNGLNRIGMSMPASAGGQQLPVSDALPGLSMQPVPKPFNAAQRAVLQSQGQPGRPFIGAQPGVVHPSQINGFPAVSGPGNSNPLFLLSQAAPELRNNGNEDAVLAATALSALNGGGSPFSATSPDNNNMPLRQASPPQPAPGPPRAKRASAAQQAAAAAQAQAEASQASSTSSGGRKRKGAANDDFADVPPPAKVGRKKGSKKAKVEEPPASDDGGDMDQDGTGSATGSGKFETEEEKRKNFLERNRQGMSALHFRRPLANGDVQPH